MARLNVEDCWWSDIRRSALIKLLGSDDAADIAAIRMWRTAQEFWKDGRKWIPREIFKLLPAADHLIQVGLAYSDDELVYVRGSSTYLDWVAEHRSKSSKGGLSSAKRPRDDKGRLLPKTSKQSPSKVQAGSKQLQASVSVSVSGSDSDSDSSSKRILARSNPSDGCRAHPGLEELAAVMIERRVSTTLQESWLLAFPDPEWIIREIRRALSWELANPKRRKKLFGKFVTNWLTRAWDQRKVPSLALVSSGLSPVVTNSDRIKLEEERLALRAQMRSEAGFEDYP